jgi:hypothetical protein
MGVVRISSTMASTPLLDSRGKGTIDAAFSVAQSSGYDGAGTPGGTRTADAPAKRRQVAVLGDRGVGKSAFCVQFVEGHFVESYNPTIESTFWKTVTYKRERIAVSIRDTAGQSEVLPAFVK